MEADPDEAPVWFRKAAEGGYGRSQHNLAFAYHQGKGVEQDFGEALKWYRRAAAEGLATFAGGRGHDVLQGARGQSPMWPRP